MVHATDATFKEEVSDTDADVMVEFYAPCKYISKGYALHIACIK